MGKIKAHEFISVDGVYESPTWTMDMYIAQRIASKMALA